MAGRSNARRSIRWLACSRRTRADLPVDRSPAGEIVAGFDAEELHEVFVEFREREFETANRLLQRRRIQYPTTRRRNFVRRSRAVRRHAVSIDPYDRAGRGEVRVDPIVPRPLLVVNQRARRAFRAVEPKDRQPPDATLDFAVRSGLANREGDDLPRIVEDPQIRETGLHTPSIHVVVEENGLKQTLPRAQERARHREVFYMKRVLALGECRERHQPDDEETREAPDRGTRDAAPARTLLQSP